jgi:AcrR family transcriptional regulator
MSRQTYHHGDLRAAILTEAARLVAERGADRVSLRELAREAGVSHAAPAHHFIDRRGLFTALAAQGFELLAAALAEARPRFLAAALAYVRFAIEHPGHYRVMFDKSLLDPSNRELAAAEAAPSCLGGSRRCRTSTPRRIQPVRSWRLGHWCTGFQCCGSTTR